MRSTVGEKLQQHGDDHCAKQRRRCGHRLMKISGAPDCPRFFLLISRIVVLWCVRREQGGKWVGRSKVHWELNKTRQRWVTHPCGEPAARRCGASSRRRRARWCLQRHPLARSTSRARRCRLLPQAPPVPDPLQALAAGSRSLQNRRSRKCNALGRLACHHQ